MSMKNGYGAPIARIFNQAGTEVFEGVTAFSYMHSEKTNDSSRIIIETGDVNLVDHPDLQEGKVLKVAFGYSGENLRVHKVWIWDVTVHFGENMIRLEIVAYCKAAYMRLNSGQDTYNNASLADVLKDKAEKNGINIKAEVQPDDRTYYNGQVESAMNFEGRPFISAARDATGRMPMEFNPNITTAVGGRKFIFKPSTTGDPTDVVGDKKYDSVPQANASDMDMISKMMEMDGTENLVAEGRDEDLIIKKRNLLQAPIKAFVYRGEPGELLEFSPAVRNTYKRKQAVSNSTGGWDPEMLKYFTGTIDASQSSVPMLGDHIELPIEVQDEVAGLADKSFKNLSPNGKEIIKEKSSEKLDNGQEWIHFEKYGVQKAQSLADFSLNNLKIQHQVDEVALTFPKPIIFPKEHIPSVETDKKAAAAKANNRRNKAEAEINECNAVIIGDPEIQSGRIITIMNVGKKFSGNYYIVSAEHRIGPEGYTTSLVIFRNGKKNLSGDEAIIHGGYIGRIVNKQEGFADDGTRELNEIPVRKD